MNAKRLYLAMCGLVVLSLAAIMVAAYMGTQLLQQKSKDVHDASLKTQALEEKQNRLRKAKVDIAKYRDLAQIAQSIVPRDKDQSRTVREITNLAADNDIVLGGITFPSSSLGTRPGAKASDSQLKAVPNIPGTYVLTITVRSDSSAPSTFENLTKFLDALEQNRRTALVTGITLTPDSTNPDNIQFTLTLDEYIKP